MPLVFFSNITFGIFYKQKNIYLQTHADISFDYSIVKTRKTSSHHSYGTKKRFLFRSIFLYKCAHYNYNESTTDVMFEFVHQCKPLCRNYSLY